jgi:hypothetical protein
MGAMTSYAGAGPLARCPPIDFDGLSIGRNPRVVNPPCGLSFTTLHVLAQLGRVEEQPAAEAVSPNPSALNKVVDGFARAVAKIRRGTVNIEEANQSPPLKEIGDAIGNVLERRLIERELKRQRGW